jgi:hypothetical protein
MKHVLAFVWVAVVCVVGLGAPTSAQDAPKQPPPIIDMHLHALPAKGWPGGPSFICPGSDFAAFDPRTKWDPNHWWETCPNLSWRLPPMLNCSGKSLPLWIATTSF